MIRSFFVKGTHLGYTLLILLLLSCGGGGSDPAPQLPPGPPFAPSASLVAEQTDYFDGVMYHRYVRDENCQIWYATSWDGIHFDRYPDPIMGGAFPVMVQDGEDVYLIVRQGDAHNLYDVSVKTKPAFIKTILHGDHFNVGVAVRDGRWHMLAEIQYGGSYALKYSWSDWPLDFNENMGPIVIEYAGNPCLRYIPERDAILAFYGEDFGGFWRVRAAVYDFTVWTVKGFTLASSGIHIADPDLGVGVEPSPLILTVGHGQNAVSSYTFSGSKLDLYDAIISGRVEMEELGVTMEPY